MLYINSACRRRSWEDHAGGRKCYSHTVRQQLLNDDPERRGVSLSIKTNPSAIIIIIITLTKGLVYIFPYFLEAPNDI